MDVGAVIAVRDGLVTRNQVFPSPDEAAAAARYGLSMERQPATAQSGLGRGSSGSGSSR